MLELPQSANECVILALEDNELHFLGQLFCNFFNLFIMP